MSKTDELRLDLDAKALEAAIARHDAIMDYLRPFIDPVYDLDEIADELGKMLARLPPQSPLGAAGWTMVPVEPTDVMRAAGQWTISDNLTVSVCVENNNKAAAVYRAMLAAAPIDRPGADRAGLVAGHIRWLRTYVQSMTEHNWRDFRLQIERQLDDLVEALSPKESR